MPEITPSKYLVTVGWQDTPHLTEQAKEELLRSTPPHLRDARSKGIPSQGAGAIYPISWEDVSCPPFQIPEYWPRCYGLDVGWNHRTAAVWLAWDRSVDIVYAYSEHSRSQAEPTVHAAAIKARGEWIPGAIDPAAEGRSQIDGRQLIEEYRNHGLDLTKADNSVEAGLLAVFDRLTTGRLKFFKTLQYTEAEYLNYHRDENGKIDKVDDDCMDAVRYAVSKLQIARVRPAPKHGLIVPVIGDRVAGY